MAKPPMKPIIAITGVFLAASLLVKYKMIWVLWLGLTLIVVLAGGEKLWPA